MASPPRLMNHLLPSNATVYERTLATQVDEIMSLDPDRIRTLWDPWKCDINDLPYLAWTLSVDVWDPSWDEQKKRSVVARSIELHRLKGTLAGMEEYAKLVGSEVIKAIVPPAGFALAPSRTPAEREAWIATLPQLRIYQDRIDGDAKGKFWIGKALQVRRRLDEKPGPEKAGHRAVIWRNGDEEAVTVNENQQNTAVVVSTRIKAGVWAYWGRKRSKMVLSDSKSHAPVFTLGIQDGLVPSPNPVPPGQKLVTVTPSYMSEVYPAGNQLRFDNKALGFGYLQDRPNCRVYYRIPIVDPNVDVTQTNMKRHFGALNVSRFGVDAHTAELEVSIPGTVAKSTWALDIRPVGLAFGETDTARLGKTFDALRRAKRLSDKVVVNTKTQRPLTAGQPIFAGEVYRAGDWTRS